jgi:hypothetical protein
MSDKLTIKTMKQNYPIKIGKIIYGFASISKTIIKVKRYYFDTYFVLALNERDC